MMNKWLDILIWQKLISLTQMINVWVFHGKADETTSSRCYRQRNDPYTGWFWSRLVKLVNWAFRDPDHCKRAYEAELAKKASWER